jgi:hypothetical protein
MATFDFISGSDFRESLTQDYKELTEASGNRLWKSVHILAGSIIEAILADYLIAIDYKKTKKIDPLEMVLFDLIQACHKEGILTDKTVGLCNVIRNYRNLIHPGRIIRLKEKVDPNSAKVALALVEMIVDEVSASRRETYGFTAEQIVSKIEMDYTAISIISHILDSTKQHEVERLLLDVIPARYMTLNYQDKHDYSRELDDLENCFRHAFDKSDDQLKKKVTKHFVQILKNESGDSVFVYETVFFRCTDLKYLNDDELNLVKTHILSSLKRRSSISLIRALNGIGSRLKINDIIKFIDPLVNVIMKEFGTKHAVFAERALTKEFNNIPSKYKQLYSKRIDQWIKANEGKDNLEKSIQTLKEITADIQPPF